MTTALGPPWERPLKGRLERLVIDSQVLQDNPLGDPSRRPLYVYLPPGLEVAEQHGDGLAGFLRERPLRRKGCSAGLTKPSLVGVLFAAVGADPQAMS